MADVLAAELAKAQVKDEHIVSFEGKGLKLDNASTGKIIVGNTALNYKGVNNFLSAFPNFETVWYWCYGISVWNQQCMESVHYLPSPQPRT